MPQHRCQDGSGSLRNGKIRLDKNGGPGESRTPDTRFRKPLLYPSELQARGANALDFISILRRFARVSKGRSALPGAASISEIIDSVQRANFFWHVKSKLRIICAFHPDSNRCAQPGEKIHD
jgi:hypothetical protein